VVPVDDSQHSLQALEWAVNNIYRSDRADEVHLLSVIPSVAGPYPAEVRESYLPKLESVKQHHALHTVFSTVCMLYYHSVQPLKAGLLFLSCY
jgi:hypothetical protein